jgi:hypothetical protein
MVFLNFYKIFRVGVIRTKLLQSLFCGYETVFVCDRGVHCIYGLVGGRWGLQNPEIKAKIPKIGSK